MLNVSLSMRRGDLCDVTRITVDSTKELEYDCPPTPNQREEAKPAQITLGPYSNLSEPSVMLDQVLETVHLQGSAFSSTRFCIPCQIQVESCCEA